MVSVCSTTVAVITVKRVTAGNPLKKLGIKSNLFVILVQVLDLDMLPRVSDRFSSLKSKLLTLVFL